MPSLSASEWSAFLGDLPETHLLQTTAWGELKAAFGWDVFWFALDMAGRPPAGAQLLVRRFPFGFSMGYIPKGPLPGEAQGLEAGELYRRWEPLWPEVDRLCREERCVVLKVEPDLFQAGGRALAPPAGFQPSPHSIQPPRTILVDLCGDEEQVLARMKQKTRYNIRLAHKKGVVVRPDGDLELFSLLMAETAERDRFGAHNLDYYRTVYELFHPRGECELLLAEFEGEPLAALMAFARGRRAWYFYGASVDTHRDRMPTYLLQWEAMRWARAQGCQVYDLWGVPDADEETLEAHFTERSRGLWGVYRFKRGFGGQLRRAAGPWDRIYQPVLYRFYLWWTRRGAGEQGTRE
jgi:lipid II:glycine glycyltransferase (peptidoglycan interpeptide bridge formation enzyme)